MAKIRRNTEAIRANKIFTDREEPREAFWNMYNKCVSDLEAGQDEIRVLTYYGIGGIGKSSLLKKLQMEMQEKLSRPHFLYFDFEIDTGIRSCLARMRNILQNEYKFQFPLFDLGLYMYAKKAGENMSAPEIMSFADRSPLLKCLLGVTENIPIVGLVSQIAAAADTGVAYLRNIINKHKKELYNIEIMQTDDLARQLPVLFSRDLTDCLSGQKEPLVIFFDTYEKLVNEMNPIGEPLNNDGWIRGEDGLVQNIPGVLWVIAGREKLKWERFDPDFSDILEQHILGNLSEEDGTGFLKEAGVTDEKLRAELYKLTGGTPVYLDLCVDRYYSLLESGTTPTADDFGNNISVLIERFARYMDDMRKDTVYMLSCLQIWTDEMATEIGKNAFPAFSKSGYDKVKEFSFVSESNEGFYSMHKLVGEVLEKSCQEEIRTDIYHKAAAYCRDRIDSIKNLTSEKEFYIRQYITYRMQVMTLDGMEDFFDEVSDMTDSCANRQEMHSACGIAKTLYDNTRTRFSESSYEKLVEAYYLLNLCRCGRQKDAGGSASNMEYLEKPDVLSFTHYGLLNSYRGEVLIYLGLYREAMDILEKLHGEYDSRQEEFPFDDLMGACYSRLGNNKKAQEFFRQAYEKKRETLGEGHPDTLASFDNLARSYGDGGENRKFLELEKQACEKMCDVLGEDNPNTLKSLHNLAVAYSEMGDHAKALELKKQAYKKRCDVLGEEHLDTLMSLHNLAIEYGKNGDHAKELELNKQAYERKCEALGEGHPSTLKSLHNLAGAYERANDYDTALKLYKQAYEKMRDVLGEEHPDTLKSLHNLAGAYERANDYDTALKLYKQVYEKKKETQGEGHPSTLRSLDSLARAYERDNDYDRALELYKQVYEKKKETQGEGHPSTRRSLDSLARAYERANDYDTAVELYKQVYEKKKETQGEGHTSTLRSLHSLARAYMRANDYAMSLKLYKQAYEGRKETLGESHPNTLSSLYGQAYAYGEMGNHSMYLETCKQAYEKRCEALGESHPDTLASLEILANAYGDIGDYDRALELVKQAYEKRREVLGEDHPNTLRLLNNLANAYGDTGDYATALELAKQAYEKRREVLGEDHPDTQKTQRLINELLSKQQ